jgi:hypothetical protein
MRPWAETNLASQRKAWAQVDGEATIWEALARVNRAQVETVRTVLAAKDQAETAKEDQTRLQAKRDVIQGKLADWTAGGLLAWAWRLLLFQRAWP